jgi:hypothetical protein
MQPVSIRAYCCTAAAATARRGLHTEATAFATAAKMTCEPLMLTHLHSCILQQLLQARLELLLRAQHEVANQGKRCINRHRGLVFGVALLLVKKKQWPSYAAQCPHGPSGEGGGRRGGDGLAGNGVPFTIATAACADPVAAATAVNTRGCHVPSATAALRVNRLLQRY